MPLETFKGDVLLIVNTASKCGLTPQYEELEELYKTHKEKGLQIVGFPCDQFGGQEPGTNEEIAQFCSATYGVSFPMMDKVDVNGADRHPVFTELTQVPDADGEAGDVGWNFEKWVVDGSGRPLARFRSRTGPTDPLVVQTIEAALAED